MVNTTTIVSESLGVAGLDAATGVDPPPRSPSSRPEPSPPSSPPEKPSAHEIQPKTPSPRSARRRRSTSSPSPRPARRRRLTTFSLSPSRPRLSSPQDDAPPFHTGPSRTPSPQDGVPLYHADRPCLPCPPRNGACPLCPPPRRKNTDNDDM